MKFVAGHTGLDMECSCVTLTTTGGRLAKYFFQAGRARHQLRILRLGGEHVERWASRRVPSGGRRFADLVRTRTSREGIGQFPVHLSGSRTPPRKAGGAVLAGTGRRTRPPRDEFRGLAPAQAPRDPA